MVDGLTIAGLPADDAGTSIPILDHAIAEVLAGPSHR
jgi:hypothetical protein